MVDAGAGDMTGAKRHKDLIVWQLSYQLEREVFAKTATGEVAKDFKFRDQIRDASASAPRNIAEGFGRYRPKEFARFLEIARGSLTETHSLQNL
jgi:four helix bundle protein